MNIKSKNLAPAILGGLVLSVASIPAFINSNSYAEGSSSYFDFNAAQCVVDSYNITSGNSVTKIEDVPFDDVTALHCSNRNIVNFRGITLFKNLETLSLSNNSNLDFYSIDFSQNTKLKSLDLANINNLYNLDLTNNPDVRYIASTRNLALTLSNGVEKLNDNDEYAYGINLNKIKWYSDPYMNGSFSIDQEAYPYTYDEANGYIYFKDRTKIPYYIYFTTNYGNYYVDTRSGNVGYRVFLNGDEDVETHNPISVNNNCEKVTYDYYDEERVYYNCHYEVYENEVIDTNEYLETVLKKIFNLEKYNLSSVEIVPPSASVELLKDTETYKKIKILPSASFNLDFHFDLKTESAKTPNTGFFTNEDGSANVSNILLSLAGISVSAFVLLYLGNRFVKKSKAKRF